MRIGIIGLGSIGKRRVTVLKHLGHDHIYGFDSRYEIQYAGQYEPSDSKARLASHELGIVVEPTLAAFWNEDPMAVLICTPPESHTDLAMAAIQHGCHVFIEKPLSIGLDGIEILACSATEKNRISLVCSNWRFHQGPATIKRWLDEGAIGEIISARLWYGSYLPDWVPGRDYRTSYVAKTGVILDVGSHLADLATWLLGPAALKSSVWRPATSIGLECDGTAELLLRHGSGVISSVGMSFEQRGYEFSIGVIGNKGAVAWDWGQESAILYGADAKVMDGEPVDPDTTEMYQAELRHFLDCCETGQQTCNPISESIKVLTLLLQAKEGQS